MAKRLTKTQLLALVERHGVTVPEGEEATNKQIEAALTKASIPLDPIAADTAQAADGGPERKVAFDDLSEDEQARLLKEAAQRAAVEGPPAAVAPTAEGAAPGVPLTQTVQSTVEGESDAAVKKGRKRNARIRELMEPRSHLRKCPLGESGYDGDGRVEVYPAEKPAVVNSTGQVTEPARPITTAHCLVCGATEAIDKPHAEVVAEL
jgi:hypothetical protein